MSGVSPQLIDLRNRIAERSERKKKELEVVVEQLDAAEKLVAELTLRRAAIRVGIDEDEQLLRNAAPKSVRKRKSKQANPATAGDEAGATG